MGSTVDLFVFGAGGADGVNSLTHGSAGGGPIGAVGQTLSFAGAGGQAAGTIVGATPSSILIANGVGLAGNAMTAIQVAVDLDAGNTIKVGDLVSIGVGIPVGIAVAVGAVGAGSVVIPLAAFAAFAGSAMNLYGFTLDDVFSLLYQGTDTESLTPGQKSVIENAVEAALPLSGSLDPIGVSASCNIEYLSARQYAPRRDPLTLDLNGNGIEATAISSNSPVLFDHNADGIKTATGWIAASDGLVVMDLNANGTIDSGRELFGDNTFLPDGALASNGYQALAQYDQNNDGKIDADDAAYTQLRVWQDANQDGVSQAGELRTLAAEGIVSVSVAAQASNIQLGNGNSQLWSGAYTRNDGNTGASGTPELSGSVTLAANNFYRTFTDDPAVTSDAAALPQMAGSGVVRDLRQAMSLGTTQSQQLLLAVQAFAATTTREAQLAIATELITKWANTSTAMVEAIDRFGSVSPAGTEAVNRADAIHQFAQSNPQLYLEIASLERFNGDPIFEQLMRLQSTDHWAVSISPEQQMLLEQSWTALQQSVYSALVLQTRLQPYLNSVNLVIGTDGVTFDTGPIDSMLASRAATDPIGAVSDVVDLVQFGSAVLDAAGWQPEESLGTLLEQIVVTPQIRDLVLGGVTTLGPLQIGSAAADTITGSAESGTLLGLAGDDAITDLDGNDTIDGGSGNDVILDAGSGSNMLRGDGGNDTITFSNTANNTVEGGSADDLIKVNTTQITYGAFANVIAGGTGNDVIQTGQASDTFLFNRGDGQDTIFDNGVSAPGAPAGADKIVLGSGIAQSDVTVLRQQNDDLVLKVADPSNAAANDRITIQNWYDATGRYCVETVSFADGTSLTSTQLSDMGNTIVGTPGDDTLTGASGVMPSQTISGLGGNDTITDPDGSDTLDGGDGNDTITDQGYGTNVLKGGAGNDTITFSNTAADTIDGGSGDDLIKVNVLAANSNYVAYSNAITGGAGNDTIQAGPGAETYIFNRGDGQDTISDYGIPASGQPVGSDKISFGAGITTANVTAGHATDGSLVLFIADPSNPNANDQITVQNWYTNANYLIESATFADGSSLSSSQLTTMGNSVIAGTEGNDTLTGDTSAQSINGLGGNDTISDTGGSDTIDGGSGNDSITDQGNGTNVLKGGSGNDTVTYSNGASNTIDGGSGDDLIKISTANSGSQYVNTITGGLGNDTIQGGGGTDTYIFNRGDGQDTLQDISWVVSGATAGNDKLSLGAGITQSDLSGVRLSDNSLVLKIADSSNPNATDQITIQSWYQGYQLETIAFADGATMTGAQLSTMCDQVLGTSGDDTLTGFSDGAQTINGLAGNDTITDPWGSDTIDGGDGNDSITDQSYGTNVIKGGNGNDTITFSPVSSNTIDGGSGNDLIKIASANSSSIYVNTITGGLGNDTIQGGGGTDTYIFNRGDGQDTIQDLSWVLSGATAGNDKLSFGTGITQSNLSGTRQSNGDLVLKIADPSNPNSADQITIQGWYNGYQIETVTFADGSSMTAAQVGALCNAVVGTAGNDTLTGYSDNQTINGLAGNDTITDPGGSDTIDGGDGNDSITDNGNGTNVLGGGNGNDTITFSNATSNAIDGGTGDDLIKIATANSGSQFVNTITGGLGNDTLQGGGGTDTYVFNRGDGQDTILDTPYVLSGSTVGSDKISFGAGITQSNLTAFRVSDGGLLLKVADPSNPASTDQITIQSWYNNGFYIETFMFADGSSMTQSQLNTMGLTNLLGTSSAESITGTSAADTINGLLGNDTLTGGADADSFRFDTAPGSGNVDTITDFQSGVDTIVLSTTYFGDLGAAGTRVGPSSHLTYEVSTGKIFYLDAVGDPAVLVAILGTSTHPASLGNDFLLS